MNALGRRVEVNKPNTAAHGLLGVVIGEGPGFLRVDVDGMEGDFLTHELLFIEYREKDHDRSIWIVGAAALGFAAGTLLGWLARGIGL